MTTIPHPENAKGFVFGDSEEGTPRKVLGITPAEIFFVNYTDGESRKQTRLAVRAPGSKSVFLFQEKIQGQYVATVAADWFQKGFSEKMKDLGYEEAPNESTEGAEQL
jgi:hypothetical protein